MRITGEEAHAKREKAESQGKAADGQVLVYLDGIEQYNVITADDEQGFVEVAVIDKDGDFFTIDDEVATLQYRGAVRIELPEWWQA